MIIGRLTRDPELRTIPSGISVCALGLATNYVYTNQATGQKVEQVEYHNVTLWRKLGEIANQYLKKGRRVYIEGRLQTRSWEGQDGQKRYKTDIVADNMIMLDGGSSASGGSPSSSGQSGGETASSDNFSKTAATPQSDVGNQPPPQEELPTIQQDEPPVNVEDIPF